MVEQCTIDTLRFNKNKFKQIRFIALYIAIIDIKDAYTVNKLVMFF